MGQGHVGARAAAVAAERAMKKRKHPPASRRPRRGKPSKSRSRESSGRSRPRRAASADVRDVIWERPAVGARVADAAATDAVWERDVSATPRRSIARVRRDVGLTFADADSLDNDGMALDPKTGFMVCKYGCIGFRRLDGLPGFHHYACVYWDREGKERTPFD